MYAWRCRRTVDRRQIARPLRIEGDLTHDALYPCDTFNNDTLAPANTFKIDSVEIWGFGAVEEKLQVNLSSATNEDKDSLWV